MNATTTSPSRATGPAGARAAVVETAGLAKSFGDVEAVRGVDLTVPAHSIFGFLGPNGAGKTTTIKMLVGLLRPTAGTARVLGLDAVTQSLELRRRVGFLPQQPVFYDDMTARETLRYAGGFFHFGAADLDRRIGDVLHVVGLAGRADRSVVGFSGGERQRLGLAQAMLHDPQLLVLDEPAAGLDPLGRRDVLVLLERLRERATVLYSTHILDDVQRVSDTVAIIRDGTLIAQGPIASLLAGRDGITYRLELAGDTSAVEAHLQREPWVTVIDRDNADGRAVWHVGVSDEQAADRQLLRTVVADPEVTVLAYGRQRHDLEDAFIHLVEQESQP
ncbi:MAG TPA: ABC transporter ATP-binding protein [Euzebyales bacterium]